MASAGTRGEISYTTNSQDIFSPPHAISICNNNSPAAHNRIFWLSPVLDPDIDRSAIQVRFKAKSNKEGVSLSVGLMNKGDLNSFVPGETIPLSPEWVTYIVTFENIPGSGQCIAFGNESNASYSSIFLDNIDIDYIPQCPEIIHIRATEPTDRGFTLHWKSTQASSYTIEYRVTGSDSTETVVSETNSCLFGNLSQNTPYSIRIKGDCFPELWSEPFAISTLMTPPRLPFTEDFEEDPEWLFKNGSASGRWVIGNDSTMNAGSGGNFCLYITDSALNSGDHTYAYKPLLFEEAGCYIVKYQGKNLRTPLRGGGTQAWLVPEDLPFAAGTPPVTTNWVNVYGFDPLWKKLSWEENEVAVRVEEPGVYNLVFYWEHYYSGSPPVSIDNISISKTECSAPDSIYTGNIYLDIAEIHFKAPSDAHTVCFYYKPNRERIWTDTVEVRLTDPETDTVHVLRDLTPNTFYDICFATVCHDSSVSCKSPVHQFKSACTAEATPWNENFYNGYFLFSTNCWSLKEHLYNPAETIHTSDMETVLKWEWRDEAAELQFSRNNGPLRHWLITPEIDLGNSGMSFLQFDIRFQGNYFGAAPYPDDKFIVLISADGGNSWDSSHATEWSSRNDADFPFASLPFTYQTVTLPLTGITGIIKIAFYGESSFTDREERLSIDNITVLKCLEPLNVTLYDYSDTTVKISWMDDAASPSQWEIAYGIAGSSPDDLASYIVNDTVFEMTGLSADTRYDVYIRCTCANSDPGNWVKKSFITQCPVITQFPFIESFEENSSTNSCWRIYKNHNGSSQWYASRNHPHSGNTSKVVFKGRGDERDDYLISPPLGLTGNEKLGFFVAGSYSNSSQDYQVLLSTTDDTPESFTTLLFSGTIPRDTAYEEIMVDVSDYTGKSYMAFHIPEGTQSFTFYLDDVYVEPLPNCRKPTDPYVADVTAGTATLGWRERSEAAMWEIEYGPVHTIPGSETTVIASTNPYTLSGITSSTAYKYRVRSVCAAGDTSEWSDTCIFHTACGNVTTLPYSENFDTYPATSYTDSGSIPVCWTTFTDNTEYPAPHIVKENNEFSYVQSSPNSLIMTSGRDGENSFAVLPLFTDSVYTLQITFQAATEISSIGTLAVGYLENGPDDWQSFTPVYTVPFHQNATMNSYRVNFSEYNVSDQARYIAFRWKCNSEYYSVCLDDIYVEKIIPAPCLAPSSLSANSINPNSIIVNWSPGRNETEWVVEYRDSLSTLPFQVHRVRSTSDTLRYLTPNTCYHIRVKAVCGTNRTSEYTDLYYTTEASEFIITATADGGGMINPSGNIRVFRGGEQVFTIGTHSGNRISDVLVNDIGIGVVETYIFRNIRANHTIHVQTTLGTKELSKNTVTIYPNPAHQSLYIETDSEFETIRITNLPGQVIYRDIIRNHPINIDIQNYTPGIYFISLYGKEGTVTKKFVKE